MIIFKEIAKKLNQIGFFYVFFSNIVTKLLGLLLIILLSKFLTKEDLGTLSYMQAILSFINPFISCGLPYGLFIFLARENKYGISLIKLSFKIATICNLLLLAVFFAFIISIPFTFSNALEVFTILFFSNIIQSYRLLITSTLRGLKKNHIIAILNIINSITIFIIVSIGSYFAKLKGYLFGILLAQIFNFFFNFFFVFKNLSLNTRKKFNQIYNLIALSLSAASANLFSIILYNIDIVLIGILLKDAQLTAEYYVASIIPANLVFFSKIILEVFQPYIASHYKDKDWVWLIYKKLSFILFLFNSFLVLWLLLLGSNIIILLFGVNYMSSITVFNILLINFLVVGSFRVVSGNIIASLGLVKYNILINLSSIILNILLNIPFILSLGIKGAAMATLITNLWDSLIGGLVIYFYCRR